MRLLYVVTEDWYFLSHRLPMARAARDAGFDVHVATRVSDGASAIETEGFSLHPVPFVRGQLSPFGTLATIRELRAIHRRIAPDVVHHVSLQSTVLGSLAALGRPASGVNALTGLGYIFTSGGLKARLLRPALGLLMRFLLNRPKQAVLVQNPDDRRSVMALGIAPERIAMIPGSGVDTDRLKPVPEPAGPITVAFVGRLLADKGIHVLIDAQRLLRRRGVNLDLLIAGTPDPANPASVSQQEAEAFGREPGVTWLGHVSDIGGLWSRAHIAVLPSRREGAPLSLLEAAACGRPLIASDVPGCREVVLPGQTGVLVPFGDPEALADAMASLAASPGLRAQYGEAARRLAEERFSATSIGRQAVDLYRHVVR